MTRHDTFTEANVLFYLLKAPEHKSIKKQWKFLKLRGYTEGQLTPQ